MSERMSEIDLSQVTEPAVEPAGDGMQAPSERDGQIYEQVVMHLRKQSAVAKEFGLSQVRISQIVAEVRQFMDHLLPGGGLDARLAEAKLVQLELAEALARRKVNYGRAEQAHDRSLEMLITRRTVYQGDCEEIKSVVVTQRQQRVDTGAINTMERINDKIEAALLREASSGFGVQGSGDGGQGTEDKTSDEPPAEILEEDRTEWTTLNAEEKEHARWNLEHWGSMPLAKARLAAGSSLYRNFPWRNHAEALSASQAECVVQGTSSLRGYFIHLEVAEKNDPQGYPNLLSKDRSGQWRVLTPAEVPQRGMPPEREVLPENSPERVYWPFKSRAEHYAMMRAQMVLAGHLSRDEYESLNALFARLLKEVCPDPLAEMEKVKSAEGIGTRLAECGAAEADREDDTFGAGLPTSPQEMTAGLPDEPGDLRSEAGRGQETRAQPREHEQDCKIENANCTGQIGSLPFAVSSLQSPGDAPAEPELAELERQARFQLDYAFSLAMRDEDIAEALAHQRRADRGQFVADAYNRTQIAALRQWQEVKRRKRRRGLRLEA